MDSYNRELIDAANERLARERKALHEEDVYRVVSQIDKNCRQIASLQEANKDMINYLTNTKFKEHEDVEV